MKKTLIRLACALLACQGITAYAADTYTLDPNHSYVQWHISHFDFSHPSGKWFAEGTVTLDKQKPQDSKVNVVIHVADMDTGIPELNKHLKGQVFFDVDKFPTATFVSDKVTLTGKDKANVRGMLTLHGVTKPVTLAVKLNKEGVSPITNKPTVGFTASTTLNRSDFDMKTLLPGLGDKVKIDIEAEGYKAQ